MFRVGLGTISGRTVRATRYMRVLFAAGLAVAFLAAAYACFGLLPAGEARSTEPRQSASRADMPRVTIALLPNGAGLRRLAEVPEIAPGLMSAGLGRVLPDQTYLDISQGARAFNSLYDAPLPLVLPRGERIKNWSQIVERAESAPGHIEPGLFTSYLNLKLNLRQGRSGSAQGFEAVLLQPELVVPALMAADRQGRTARSDGICGSRDCRPPVLIRNARFKELPQMVADLEERDLLIAMERPPPEEAGMLSVGIAGAGFKGNLTSGTTRTPGYVLATDIAPTIIDHFGFEVPPEMTGRPIRSGERRDVKALISLEERMSVVAPRRGPVLGFSVLLWIALCGTVAILDLVRRRRRADGSTGPSSLPLLAWSLRLLALSTIYLPAVLLIGAALRPELGVERLLLATGAPVLAALTLRIAPGWRALAVACAVTVISHAVDVLSGSPLIALSLLGPNPGLGVRFYGIGNELGATLSVLLLIGIGAGLAGFARGLNRKVAAVVFVAVALPFAAVFAAGRFGADVGSAMVIPAAAVVAAAVVLRRMWLAVAALLVPVIGLVLLVAVDLISGGDSHFQRTVLDSRGGDLLDTIGRRLRLTGRSFVRAASGPFLPLTAILIGLGVVYRARISLWLKATPRSFRAGIAGAAFAAVLGTAVNDSGVLLLEVGTAYLLLVLGFVWAESADASQPAGRDGDELVKDERAGDRGAEAPL